MTTATKKATKTVHVIARVQFKADSRKVVYLVRGSRGQQYETYLFNGKATSCTCDSRKPCYHMIDCENKEAERTQVAEIVAQEAHTTQAPAERSLGDEIVGWIHGELSYEELSDAACETIAEVGATEWEEYESWKAQNSPIHMTREQYVQVFDPCMLGVS